MTMMSEQRQVEISGDELTELVDRIASVKCRLHACATLLFSVGAVVACFDWAAGAIPLAIAPTYLWMALQ